MQFAEPHKARYTETMALQLYESLPDKNIIFRVNERFYKKVYEHPWLSKFFSKTDQNFITRQQTDFIIGAIGGPRNYSGRFVADAHPHIFIDEEVFDLREALLEEAMLELKAPEALRTKWLQIDASFKNSIIKQSVDACKKRFFTDEIIHIPKSR